MEEKSKIETSINKAIDSMIPDIFPEILAKLRNNEGAEQMTNTGIIENKIQLKKAGTISIGRITKWAGIIAAVFILTFGIYFGYSYYNTTAIIGLDINPSIELKINKNEKVLEIKPLNGEAEAIIDGMKLKNVDLDIALNALIGSMVKNGYISDISNSILVSIDSNNPENVAVLKEKLTSEINELLRSFEFEGAVLSQSVSHDDEIALLASQYDISIGKAALISILVNQYNYLSFADLAVLPINDINILIAEKQAELNGITSSGKASNSSYIGNEEAKNAAFTHAQVNKDDILAVECEMDFDDGIMMYEIEFKTASRKYEYDINAKTAEIISFEIKEISGGVINPGDEYITYEQAKSKALEKAGIAEDKITNYKIKLDTDDGVHKYEIEFKSGNTEYEIEIHAVSGNIIKYETDIDDDDHHQNESNDQSANNFIGYTKAKELALKKAGVNAGNIFDYKIELDEDDGIYKYEIEFKSGKNEYELEIHAVTGNILKYEVDIDDDIDDDNYNNSNHEINETTFLSKTKAKEIALKKAAITEEKIREYEIELDEDDDLFKYEIEFKSGNIEYKFEIDALTGNILKYETELDD